MGQRTSNPNYFMNITNCDKTLSPGKFATFENYCSMRSWIHREFNLPGKKEDYEVENYKLYDEFNYPQTVTLIHSHPNGTTNSFQFKFQYRKH
jgi:hypothetical protein